ncbi:MAG TPA: Do family serine endopeptidase [Nitrospinae bacterium]|jgi:serine protease Do|nr:Do family serine endopeptidase [Nitrospinota bacterium]
MAIYKSKHFFASFIILFLSFPIFNGNNLNSAFALSAKVNPVGTNLIVEIAKNKNPAVVFVTSKTKFQPARGKLPQQQSPFRQPGPFGAPSPSPQQPHPGNGSGTGFIIDKEGYILTNNHVVDNADIIKITLQNEKEYEAELIGSDSKTDIALLKIIRQSDDKTSFPYLTMGNSEKVEVGEWVVAIGNPFGLSHTVTTGVVSAKARNIGAGPYDEFIQTDASINPGNSGGPLLNMEGKVIGINTAIYSRTGGNVGIGFTIPINMASDILDELKKDGKVTRGWLGVMVQKITTELAGTFKLIDTHGALVSDVIPNGPAARSGLKRGDIIVKFNGKEILSVENLPKQVAAVEPGKSVKVEIIRDGNKKSLDVTLDIMQEEKQA